MAHSIQPSDPSGVTGKLSNWIHDFQLSSAPPEVTTRAKYLLLDGIGCAIVAAHLPWSETAANGIFRMDPTGKCTVIGWDKKLPPLSAALLNSTFVQGFELDDYSSTAPLHSNSLLIPALFAAAESIPFTFTGNDLLRAYIVGCEVGPRVGLALHGADLLSRGWHSGAVQGPSATTAALSSLLKLTPNQIEWAFGMACTQAGGLMSAQFGSMAKRMQHGFASRNGLFAALMARENYTGIEKVFETPYGGFLSCFGQGANFEPKTLPDELISGLGERWEQENIRIKVHASMAALHGTIDCIEHLQERYPEYFRSENLENIEKITTEHGRAAYEHGGWIAPPDKPMTSMGAQMSIQYAAATQLVDREVLMAQFGAQKLNRPQLREIMAKTTPTHDKKFDESKKTGFRTVVTIRFKDGKEVDEGLDAFKGIDPPVSNEDIVDKWRRLTRGVLDDQRREAIEKMVLSFETLKDVNDLFDLLGGIVPCPIDI